MKPNLDHTEKFDIRISIAVILGNTIAWADFALYAYFSPILGQVFFPFTDYSTGVLLYFIIFALAFLFRPIGSAIAGAFADRYGRKNTLLATVILSTIFTTLIGALPSYTTIGIWSPILLTLLRILQTMAISAEPTNSSALLIEHAKNKKRGFITSCVMSGVFLGFFLGIFLFLLVTYALDKQQIESWGWRLPFLSSLIIGVLVTLFLLGTKESPLFLEKKASGKISEQPIRLSLQTQRKGMFLSFGYGIMMSVGNYFLLGFIPNMLTHNVGLTLKDMNLYVSIGLLVSVILIPIFGYISDYVGRRPIMAFGAVGFIVMSYPILYLLKMGTPASVTIGLVIYGIALAGASAVLPTAISEMFPFQTRCTASAIGYNASLVLFGGTTPIIAELLYKYTSDLTSLFWYISLTALVHLMFIIFSKETKNVDITK